MKFFLAILQFKRMNTSKYSIRVDFQSQIKQKYRWLSLLHLMKAKYQA